MNLLIFPFFDPFLILGGVITGSSETIESLLYLVFFCCLWHSHFHVLFRSSER